jgi:hypothetical protein
MIENLEDLAKNIKKDLAEMRKIRNKLNEEQGVCDLTVAEYYHLFENGKFPANVSSKLLKQFKECLQNRRAIKKQLAQITSLDDLIKNKGISVKFDENKFFGGTEYRPKYLKEEFEKYKQYIDFKVIL